MDLSFVRDEYSRSGFLAASATFDPKDLDVDLSGKTFMITGANTGMGKVVSLEVAKRGGTVHMMCIMSDEDTRKEIMDKSGNKNVHLHVLDLSRPKQVYQFAKQFADRHDSLDVLVNNAGFPLKRPLTEDGLDMIFAVNSLAPYILTTTLLPLLRATPGSRVVQVASAAAFSQKLDAHDMQKQRCSTNHPSDGLLYAQTKRQLITMTEMWARACPGIHFSSMHPGGVDTGMTQLIQDRSMLPQPLRMPEEGADTTVWLSISPSAVRQASGQFFFDRKAVSSHLPIPGQTSTECTEDEKERLMENLEKMTADYRGSSK